MLLKDEEAEVRIAAVLTLSKIAPRAAEAVPLIKALLSDADPGMREAAVFAWTKLPASEITVQVVQAMLDDAEPRVRYDAIHALIDLAQTSEEAEEILSGLLRDPNQEMRRRATLALQLVERRKTSREKFLENAPSANDTP